MKKNMMSIYDAFDNLFNVSDFPSIFEGTGNIQYPQVDIKDSKTKITFKAVLPGLTAKDINIEISDNTLLLSGEHKEEKKESTENYVKKESYYGSFKRSFLLPQNIDVEKTDASYKNGILVIELPKKTTTKKGATKKSTAKKTTAKKTTTKKGATKKTTTKKTTAKKTTTKKTTTKKTTAKKTTAKKSTKNPTNKRKK